MFDAATFDLLRRGFNVLLVGALPILVVTSLVGFIFAVLQGATNIHDHTSAYALRVVAVVIVCVGLLASWASSLAELMRQALMP